MGMQLPRGTYYGRTIARREVAGLILTEKRHVAGERLPPHAHDQPYLCFVLSGSWRERYDGGVRMCAPRSLIYHPAGETHSDDFGAVGAHLFDIELDATWLSRMAATSQPMDEPQTFDGRDVSTTAIRLYDEARRSDMLSPLVIEGLTLELLGACLRSRLDPPSLQPPRWLRDTAETLEHDFRQPPALGDLALRAGVHPVHLARAFRRHFGCSIGEYVRQRKLDFVCRELASSTRRLTEIALDAGFADQSHLTKTFRRSIGTTPAQYRASALRDSGGSARSPRGPPHEP
jgi:AraC-like DNA-binding protein